MNLFETAAPTIDIRTLVKLRNIFNLAEIARMVGLKEPTFFAMVRRATEAIEQGRPPRELDPKLARDIAEALCTLGITVY